MHQVIPPPRGPRALFELFALLLPGKGIDSILDPVDFTGMDEAGVLAAFGRKPAGGGAKPDYTPRAHLRALLQAPDFPERVRPMLLNAYPNKKRAIFVHIPKCAGTDLTAILRRRYPTLQQMVFKRGGVPTHELFHELRDIVLGLRYSDTIAVTGHERLAYYQGHHSLVRPQDWFFTTVRDPAALIYSHLNYVLTVCRDAPRTRRPDGLAWLADLALKEIPEDASADYMAGLARRILHDPVLTPANTLCGFLGDGSAPGARQAIAATNIEITDMARYSAWRDARFPGETVRKENKSVAYFTPEMALPADRNHVAALTEQDQILFAAISKALDRGGGLSVTGEKVLF